MNPGVHFTAHGLEFRADFSYHTRPASWALVADGREFNRFPVAPDDTHDSVLATCRAWLASNAFEALVLDVRHLFVRLTRESLRAHQEDPSDFTSWLVLSQGAYVTHLPITTDPSQEAAVAALNDWLRTHPIICVGGPWDGRRVAFQGESFRPPDQVLTYVNEAWRTGHQLTADGHYLRSEAGYVWTV